MSVVYDSLLYMQKRTRTQNTSHTYSSFSQCIYVMLNDGIMYTDYVIVSTEYDRRSNWYISDGNISRLGFPHMLLYIQKKV